MLRILERALRSVNGGMRGSFLVRRRKRRHIMTTDHDGGQEQTIAFQASAGAGASLGRKPPTWRRHSRA
jgi:hypothetical protein